MSFCVHIGLMASTLLCAGCSVPRRIADLPPRSARSGSPVLSANVTNAPSTGQREDRDLVSIPGEGKLDTGAVSPVPAARAANQRISLEDAFVLTVQRSGQVVPSSQQDLPVSSWQNLLFLDFRKQWPLHDRLTLTLSDRINLRSETDLPALGREDVINNFREGYLSWHPADKVYFDLGRINVKSGAALGFNPSDFFKSRSVQVALTADPSALREDRFGTLMLETQYIGEGRALTVAVAPALVAPGPIYTDTTLPSFDPSINCTNAFSRILIRGSINLGSDFSPELIFYREGNLSKAGANLTRSIGQRVVVYGEWAGGEQSGVIDRALQFGRRTGTIPVGPPSVIYDNPNARFQNDVAVGASVTPGTKFTVNLEYHFHEAGFSGSDWSRWFSTGRGQPGSSSIAQELWYIREYSNDRQEPIAMHSAFLRADWPSFLTRNLELSGFIDTDMHDGSSLVQASVGYNLSDRWSAGAQVTAYLGSRISDFGSLPQTSSTLFEATRYF